jgi:outer membrane receptor protein involved in Fe transport
MGSLLVRAAFANSYSDLTTMSIGTSDRVYQQFFSDRDRVNNPQTITLDSIKKTYDDGTWSFYNSFRAAYLSWDEVETWQDKWHRTRERIRSFSDEYSLDEFYVLYVDWTEQQTNLGLELIKSPMALSGTGTNNFTSSDRLSLPLPFVAADFHSQKNAIALYFEQEITLSDRLNLSIEAELSPLIQDLTETPDIPTIELRDNDEFSLVVELTYQLNDSVSVYGSFTRSWYPFSEENFRGEPFQPEIDDDWEVGIETKLLGENLTATVAYYQTIAQNVAIADADYPDFNRQIEEQTTQGIDLSLIGAIAPGWNAIVYYTSADARISRDSQLLTGTTLDDVAKYSSGFWSTYEMKNGLGFGGGVSLVGETAELPAYARTDLVFFYHQPDWKAAINIENLFDVADLDGTPLTLVGTVLVKF